MFFSVKNSIKIGGKTFRPCVCYEVTPYLELTIKKLAEEDKVILYNERVYFCNGKILDKKAVEKPAVVTEKSKKEKKTKPAPVQFEETVKEEVPSPEEVADDLGGF